MGQFILLAPNIFNLPRSKILF